MSPPPGRPKEGALPHGGTARSAKGAPVSAPQLPAPSTAVQAAPRHFIGSGTSLAILPGPGLPQDRHARIAARRCFVELERQFMAAVAGLDGGRSDWLRYQVRQSCDPVDLWLLRGLVFIALERAGTTALRTQRELQQLVDQVFPDGGQLLPYGRWP